MAIGVEQLDIKNVAKVFLMKKDLGKELAAEDFKDFLRIALENLNEEDWDNIRTNIFPSSDEKKSLRETIEMVKEFYQSCVSGNREGQYSKTSLEILYRAIKGAEGVIRTYKDDTVEEREFLLLIRALLINAKERCLSSQITEDGVKINIDGKNYWYGPSKSYDRTLEWRPVKIINDHYWVSLYDIPANYPNAGNLVKIRGLWINDTTYGKQVIFTRDAIPFINENVEIIDSVIFDNILYCAEEDVYFATSISYYLEKIVNVAPCRFNGTLLNGDTTPYVHYNADFQALFNTADLTETVLKDIFKVEELKVSIDYNPSATILTAPKSSGYFVDNVNHIITNVGAFAPTLHEEIENTLLSSSGAVVSLTVNMDITEIKVQVTSEDGKVAYTYKVHSDFLMIDPYADTIDGKYYSKYRPVDDSELDWIPVAMIDGKYYISPERINENHKLYVDNHSLIHIVGVLDEESGTIFTRCNINRVYPELSDPEGKYRFNIVNGGYYNGYWFGGSSADADVLDRYLKYLPVFRNKMYGQNRHLGFVQSEFIAIESSNTLTSIEDEFYWSGAEADVIKLPNTRTDCKFYLDVVAIKAK